MKVWIATIIFLICAVRASHAQRVEETLPFLSEPQKQWIAIATDNEMRLVSAELEKLPDRLKVSAFVKELSTEALVAAVVLGSDGKVYSSALHRYGEELVAESQRVAQMQAQDLKSKILVTQRQIQELEQENKIANTKLRRAAGLDEIDAIYDKIAELDHGIEQANQALKDNN